MDVRRGRKEKQREKKYGGMWGKVERMEPRSVGQDFLLFFFFFFIYFLLPERCVGVGGAGVGGAFD